MLTLFENHFEVVQETESRWVSKCIVGIYRRVENASPKTVLRCTLTTTSTCSPTQPQSGEIA